MYILKQICSDFVVEEIADFDIDLLSLDRKKYSYYSLEKRDISHFLALKIVSKKLAVSVKDINYSGTKDKKARTMQYISVRAGKKYSVPQEIGNNIKLEFLGYFGNPLSLGSHQGNKFTIVVRGLEKGKYVVDREKKYFLNYFDSQRFSKNNISIGKSLLLKDFSSAAKLIDDVRVQECLLDYPSQPVKAISLLSRKEISLYLHAYQSYLFNETLRKFVEEKCDEGSVLSLDFSFGKLAFVSDESVFKDYLDLEVSLPGFLELRSSDSLINSIQKELLVAEAVCSRDFIIKQFSNLSVEGTLRPMLAEVKNFEVVEVSDDELNPGKEKFCVSFELGKGSYATMLIKQIVRKK